MTHKLPDLPYAIDALSPYISEETINYHYGKHHAAYVNNLNKLTANTDMADLSLEELIMKSDGGIFNNAAQVWNHTFYWHSLSPEGGNEPSGNLATAINNTFGSFASFKEQFTDAAMKRFGSGWAWLVKNEDNTLEIISTPNAENPMTNSQTPLLTCDVWEHAYYIDTRNNRGQYLENFWKLANWSFAEQNFADKQKQQ
jgi:superoxide dismutase, Fe-Mn family